MSKPVYLTPNWPAPSRVRAIMTTRQGGTSKSPYHSLNLAHHSGDSEPDVATNRSELKQALGLKQDPLWLQQVHQKHIIHSQDHAPQIKADGCYSETPQQVCAVLTADCLPLLLSNNTGRFVMALHVGWRGLAAGIIETALDTIKTHYGLEGLIAWLGPAINQHHFEVGEEVKKTFTHQEEQAEQAFIPSPAGRWLMDLYKLAQQKLRARNVRAIYMNNECTYANETRFFSYRRDGATGRMATLIWLEP
jgi:YfiH family protein